MSGRKKKVLYMNLRHRTSDRSTAPPNHKKRRTVTPPELKDNAALSMQSLPPEVVEHILLNLSAFDVIAFGSTCRYFHELSLSQRVWKRLCLRNLVSPTPSNNDETNWKRLAILKLSQGLVLQRLNSGLGNVGSSQHHARSQQLTVVRPFNTPMAQGFRRVVPILDHTLLWDYKGTIFILFTPRGSVTWQRPYNYSVLCYQAKDFAVDPRANLRFRQYIYVLMSHEVNGDPSVSVGHPGSIPHTTGNFVDVFQWDTHQRAFRMTFHFSLSFTQVRLSGPEANRSLLLLSDTGKVYSLHVNETQFNISHSYTLQLSLKRICHEQPDLPIKQVHSSLNSIVYITADGSVFTEVHSAGAYRQLFGTYSGYTPSDVEIYLPLSLPYKVVKCSIGLNHICLLDTCGRIFMQGCNRYGQLGTGDKIDRGEPTLVVVSLAPVDVWCGLNHSLVLLEAECGDKQVQGCGCGSRGRLPGCLEGSPVFVRLNVKVPRAATSLCSSRECLFLLCCHDIAEPPARCYNPPVTKDQKDAEREQEEENEKLQFHLTQMKRCASTNRQVGMLQSAVNQHMTGLSSVHKAFLDAALTIVLDHYSGATANKQQQTND